MFIITKTWRLFDNREKGSAIRWVLTTGSDNLRLIERRRRWTVGEVIRARNVVGDKLGRCHQSIGDRTNGDLVAG